MSIDTSGLLFTQLESGGVMLEIVDYNVGFFGGGDYERRYNIDKENEEKLETCLKLKHSGSLEEMLIKEFGKEFDILEFQKFCKENNIEYSVYTWF